jgi:hypothetical protein
VVSTYSDEMTDAEAEALLLGGSAPGADYDDVPRETAPAADGETVDPDAPYGRYPSGRRRKAPLKGKSTGRGAAQAPAAKAAKRSSGKSSATGTYGDRITEALKLPTALLAIVGNARKSEALVADAATLQLHGPSFGASLGGLAEKKPEVAAALDKILAAGPYGEIVACVAVMGLQFAANHNVLKPVESMGIMSRETLISATAAAE